MSKRPHDDVDKTEEDLNQQFYTGGIGRRRMEVAINMKGLGLRSSIVLPMPVFLKSPYAGTLTVFLNTKYAQPYGSSFLFVSQGIQSASSWMASYWTIVGSLDRLGWEQCKWCWRWDRCSCYMYNPDDLWHDGPLCNRCMELEEPPLWPNHRQRCELFVWRMFGNGVNHHHQHREWAPRRLELHWDLCCAIASFVSKPWLP